MARARTGSHGPGPAVGGGGGRSAAAAVEGAVGWSGSGRGVGRGRVESLLLKVFASVLCRSEGIPFTGIVRHQDADRNMSSADSFTYSCPWCQVSDHGLSVSHD